MERLSEMPKFTAGERWSWLRTQTSSRILCSSPIGCTASHSFIRSFIQELPSLGRAESTETCLVTPKSPQARGGMEYLYK